ncbi:MAG: RNA polymerase sigma-54 factor, partial [Nitrospinota bacterium]|nr:RNA polymerase sigma-54 factor [Nitrospinota bacterium]
DEDAQRPLTDQRIVDLLRGRNVEIARRTVTKYRKELRIPPASRRKRVAL